MKYSIHILTTHKHINRQKCILDTWLKDKINYFFYTDKSTNVGNQVQICDNDTYFSNGIKNIGELIRVYNLKHYENVDWMFFCDDDTCVNLRKLENLLPTLDKTKMYGHMLSGTWPEDTSLSYLSGGAGYLLSSDTLKKFKAPSLDYLKMSFYSDVCVGFWARDNNIESINIKGFYPHPPKDCKLTDNEIKNCYTFHYIKECNEVKDILKKFENGIENNEYTDSGA